MLSKQPDLQTVSLNEIARRARMAKSNVYRYFETREDLMLALLWEEWAGWRVALESWLETGAGASGTLRSYASWVAASLAERELLCALTAALPSIVEHNLSEGRIREFKTGSLGFFQEVGARLARAHPALEAERHSKTLYDLACLISGIYPHARPARAVARVVGSPGLAWFRRDLESDLERYFWMLLHEKAV